MFEGTTQAAQRHCQCSASATSRSEVFHEQGLASDLLSGEQQLGSLVLCSHQAPRTPLGWG